MSCVYPTRGGNPPPIWHRWTCRECRSAYRADRIISLGMACLRARPVPADGLNQALRAVGLSAVSTAETRLRIRRRLRRFGILATTTLGLLGVSSAGWLWWIDRDPNITIPKPAMPSANAFDFLFQAGPMVKDDDKVTDALADIAKSGQKQAAGQSQASPSAGAAGLPAIVGGVSQVLDIVTGASVMGGGIPMTSGTGSAAMGTGPPGATGAYTPAAHVYTRQEKEALLAENSEALGEVTDGLMNPYLEPPIRSFNAQLPHEAGFRNLARLLALQANVRMERGDWAAGFVSALTAMRLGARVQHGATMSGKFVGIACEDIGRTQAWRAIDHLNGTEALVMAKCMSPIRDEHVSVADTLTEDKWAALAGLQEIFRRRGWRRDPALFPWGESGNSGLSPSEYLRLLPYSKSAILHNYAAQLDRSISAARQRYSVAERSALTDPPESLDPISSMLAPTYQGAILKDTLCETQNALLEVALALRAYRCDHGAYPASLSALTPRYLATVPEDPFSAGPNSLQYARKGAGYTLYSVGPDGADNGGTGVRDGYTESSGKAIQVMYDSGGDILAGVNYR